MPTGRTGTAPGGPPRPVLLYDGDCGFCSACVRVLSRRVRPAADIRPWQHSDLAAFGWSPEDARREVLWSGPDGRRAGGAAAVAHALSAGRAPWPAVGAALRLPALRWLAAAVYRVVARNRHRLPGGTAACASPGRLAVSRSSTRAPPSRPGAKAAARDAGRTG